MQAGQIQDNDKGYVQITSLSAATALTVPAGATRCVVTAETQAVRWRADGTSPTGSVGNPIAVGVPTEIAVAQLSLVKFIEQTASAKLNVQFYGV